MLSPGDHARSLDFGGRRRTYLVHAPPNFDSARPVPVVLAFHGGGTDARSMVELCGLNETSDREGFLAVYPDGTGRIARMLTWNAGDCCAFAMRHNVDDVGMTRALLDELSHVARVDANRVYATGMSNGAMMAYRLASGLSDRIAAVAPVAGPMGTAECRPKRPVSILHFHGTDDEFTPYAGGRGKKSRTHCEFRSVEFSIQCWIRADGCPPQGIETALPNRSNGGTSVRRTAWGPGNEDSEVVLYSIQGCGHTWPGRTPPFKFLGAATKDISANDIMWDFFSRHPMKQIASVGAR